MNNDPNSSYYKAHIAFLAAHDDFDANQRRQFGCECGDNRHIDTHWDHQTRRSWKALCAARKVWSEEFNKDLASREVSVSIQTRDNTVQCNWTIDAVLDSCCLTTPTITVEEEDSRELLDSDSTDVYNQDETNG